VPSRIDPSSAPKGKDALMILCPVGHLLEGDERDWNQIRDRARQFVIQVLSKKLNIPDFAELIETEQTNTPHSWQDKFNLWRGSALGLSHNIFQVCWFRPSPRHQKYRNMYFVGASTHPGTGVPIVLCGARVLAETIEKDQMLQTSSDHSVLLLLVFLFFSLILFGVDGLRF
jgi:phytoene desaturase (3,4-didehydrolycopene-forming)